MWTCGFLTSSIWTVKSTRRPTGLGNERVLENLKRLASQNQRVVLRTPVIPDYNDSEEAIAAIGAFVRDEMQGRS